jgi:L-histidine N-alpha-methyltransferase
MTVIENTISMVADAVDKGLSQNPKHLPSWLFYDETGDKLFQAIMKMPGYYLTGCEYQILEANKDNLLRLFKNDAKAFNLIELGAGDGYKTEILLKHFSKNNTEFIYTPVDVSESVLKTLKGRLVRTYLFLLSTRSITGMNMRSASLKIRKQKRSSFFWAPTLETSRQKRLVNF